MTTQILPNLVYAALLLIALLVPYVVPFPARDPTKDRISDRVVMAAILIGAVLLGVARQGAFLWFILLLIPLVGREPRAIWGGAAAVLLLGSVPWWWSPEMRITPALIGGFAALGVGSAFLPRLAPAPAAAASRKLVLVAILACLALGLGAGVLTAPFGSRNPIYFAWHHWGAYLAPAEAWLAGGLPYRDFPLQYGLGPTALLAATCGSDCWRSMFGVVIGANALYFAALAGCVLILAGGLSRGVRWLSLIALFCAAFIWTAFPSNLAGPAMTPSVAGLRFLPLALLLLHIIHAEKREKRRDLIGHALWLGGLLWSPEAGFFATLLWWPYLTLRTAAGAATLREALVKLVRGGLLSVGALLLGLLGLALVVRHLSRGAADLGNFLAYIAHPPGPLPVNPVGTIWLAVAALAIALQTLGKAPTSASSRSLYACVLALLAGGTYFLSRSHDNNILNLFPLLVVLLVAILAQGGTSRFAVFARGFIQTTLAAIVGLVVLPNAYPWADAAKAGDLFAIGPDRLISHFSPTSADPVPVLSSEAVEAIESLQGEDAGAIVVLDDYKIMPRARPGAAWTSVNNVANFEPLPPALIAHYIHRGAVAYCRPGWLVVDESHYASWVKLFEADYRIDDRRTFFSDYVAYRLVPKLPCSKR